MTDTGPRLAPGFRGSRDVSLRTTLPLVACGAALLLPAGASASSSTVRVGVADQTTAVFGSPAARALGVQRTRYFIKWNAIDDPSTLAAADDFVRTARSQGIDVLLHFSTDDFTPRKAKLPSRSQYRAKVGKLVSRYYRLGVREWGVWNEANDRTQPTYRSPTRAADFFVELWRLLDARSRCGASVTGKCRVVALDLLDGSNRSAYANVRSYIKRFYGRLSSTYDRRARFVGIHNYSDTNRRGSAGTKNIIDTVRKYQRRSPKFWFTETGGVLKIGDTGDFRCDPAAPASAERRAARALSWMFTLAKRYRRSVDRVYVYQWTGSDCDPSVRFDAGLVRRDGTLRPGYDVVRSQLRRSSILKP